MPLEFSPFFLCYPLNVHTILYRIYGNDVTSHRKSISIIGYLELKIHDVVKFSFPFFLFSSLSYPATVPSNGENVVLNDVTIPRMETFPATRYVDYWNREWPNKHLWNCLFTFSFRWNQRRETLGTLQPGVGALFPPWGSSIIGIKKGEAVPVNEPIPLPSSFAALSEQVENGDCSWEGCRRLELYIGWGSRVYRWICVQSGVNLLPAFP